MIRIVSILCALGLLGACSPGADTAPVAKPDAATPGAAGPGTTTPAAAEPAAPAAALTPELQARLTRPGSPVLGRATAPVTLVEFLDPACEACRAFAPVVKQIQFLYPDDVRVVVRFADFHPGSEEAIRILLAAQKQGRLEGILAALFDRQEEWASHHSPDIDAAWKVAAEAGLDVKAARRIVASPEFTERLRQEDEDITELKVARTPTFYVNGKLLEDFGAEQLMKLVAAEVKGPAAPASP